MKLFERGLVAERSELEGYEKELFILFEFKFINLRGFGVLGYYLVQFTYTGVNKFISFSSLALLLLLLMVW